MSEADKMFEEIGYKRTEMNYFQVARYEKDDDNIIYFNENKTFDKTGQYDGMCDPITPKELKAVYKFYEENGWFE